MIVKFRNLEFKPEEKCRFNFKKVIAEIISFLENYNYLFNYTQQRKNRVI